MKNLISIVVPCYNVEKYIDKCLESLVNQTYKNIEIIVVNDCSTDNTYNKLVEWKEKDERIKLINNEKNSGLSFSRNTGIKNATGKYIGFIDSDDYVNSVFYEDLMNAIERENASLAICDVKVVYESTNNEILSKCYNDDEFCLINVINSGLAASACNKLFEKELISKYEFEVGKVNEDIAVVIPALVNASKIAYASNAYYYYIQRNGSIQNSGFSDKRFDIFGGVETTLERISGCKDFEEIKDALVYNQLIVLLLYVIPKEKNKKRRKQVLRRYNELIRKYNIRQNHYYWSFLEQVGRKHSLYYRALVKSNCMGYYTISNNLISLYGFLYKLLIKPVIKKKIELDDVIRMAKYQNNLKEQPMKVSVVVPNYNYARFIYQRLYSILYQDYKINEIIILDDCSSDNSRELIDDMISKIDKYINIRKIYNEKNSGSAFKQWQLGFEHANSDYVWIAEADDYCNNKMLSKIMKPIKKDNNIMLSYADTGFIDTFGNITTISIKNEIDIMKTGHWNKNFVNNGIDEIRNYSFLNCTIANVSSAIIKKGDYKDIFLECGNFKQAGDWLFYVSVMSKGKIAYYAKPLNYYRVHGSNVTSITKKQNHFNEIVRVHNYIEQKFGLNNYQKERINERYSFLKKAWKLNENDQLYKK